KEANNPKDAGIYSSVAYLFIRLDVWYKIDPPASKHIPTENHSPKLKPNKVPATIKPIAIKKPMVSPVFKNEKSFLVTNTTAVNPLNKASVTIAACCSISGPESK